MRPSTMRSCFAHCSPRSDAVVLAPQGTRATAFVAAGRSRSPGFKCIKRVGSDQRRTAVQSAEQSSTVSAVKQLDKNFDPASEEDTYSWWESLGAFKPSSSGSATPFVVCMPPPNVTGKLHMGHAMFVTLQDIMIRYQRMRGKAALWLPGTDHAGIATQMVVEKQLAAEGTSRRELGRQEFEARVWSWKEQYGGFITQQLRRLGASCDWTRERFTLDAQLSDAVNEAFVRLHGKGLIYRGQYLVNWAPNLQTAVSDLEVEYSDENGFLYFFKYPIAGTEGAEYLPVATTRPETILGDTAVAVNPNDPRFKGFIGKQCEVPMSSGRCIPIIADEHVDMEFGTGALKITPAHDPNDYKIGKEQGLAMINIMNKDATMNASAGKYCGLDRFDCRKQLWADMEDAKLTLKKEPYQTRIPRSQRGGEVIEPMVSEQWFVKMDGLADRALKAAAAGEVQIVPQRFEKIYNQWLENIQDWCISRQLWWGHRIPVWYVFPDAAAAAAAVDGRCEMWVVARNEAEAQEIAVREHGSGVVLRQEEDVLDTWFSSGLWPFSTMGWPKLESPDFSRFYPTQVLETGHDILFFWVARMIMMALELTDQVPFQTVFLHGLVRDSQGRKMSKSLGNVLDPLDLIAEYGTDSLRYTLATGTTPGQDINLSMDRMLSSRNLTNKLWNAGKYLQMVLEDLEGSPAWQATAGTDFSDPERFAQLPLAEKWIVSELHQVVDQVTELHEKLDVGEVGRVLYDFFWSDYADWFIEVSKTRTYSDDAETRRLTQEVLVYCFSAILKLWHPFMPYITEQLWQALPQPQSQPALITASWPTTSAPADSAALEHFSILQDIVRSIRNARAEYGVDVGRRITATIVIQADAARCAVSDELAAVCLLAKLDPSSAQVASSLADAPGHGGDDGSGTIQAVVRDGVEVVLPLAGLFDAEKEIERLSKQAQKIEKELAGLTGRLSNKKFLEKAPKEVVEEAQGQAAELQEQLNAIAAKQKQMQQLL